MTSNKGLYSKWRICGNISPAFGFNFGTKVIPGKGYDTGLGSIEYWYYTNPKEKSKLGYQIAIEVVSKSFFRNKLTLRIGVGVDGFYYKGTATTVVGFIQSWGPPPTYTFITHPDSYKYYYKDHFLNICVIPQFNFHQTNKVLYYYFLGPSFAELIKEEFIINEGTGNQSYHDIYNYRATAFGITGLGSTIKITKGLNFDAQLRFNYQIFTAPMGRRFASAGLKVGFMF